MQKFFWIIPDTGWGAAKYNHDHFFVTILSRTDEAPTAGAGVTRLESIAIFGPVQKFIGIIECSSFTIGESEGESFYSSYWSYGPMIISNSR